MALAEDAASVLDSFVQDVANLPAEIAHLLEEIQAKDKVVQECRSTITTRDNSIQKFIRLNGSLTPNPKEEQYNKTVTANYEKAQLLQDEKLALSEKARVLLDRHVRRLDHKIRDLQNDGTMATDPSLPSLLHPGSAVRTSIASTPVTGASTPLNPVSNNVIPSTTIANSSIIRRAQPPPSNPSSATPNTSTAPPTHRSHVGLSHLTTSAPTTPAASSILHQRHRESSAGANDVKRRRLTSHLPATSSNLAQQAALGGSAASAGASTPKAGTPVSASRAGSAGPRLTKKQTTKKVAPHQQLRKKTIKNATAASNPRKHAHNKKSSLGPGGTAIKRSSTSPASTATSSPAPGSRGGSVASDATAAAAAAAAVADDDDDDDALTPLTGDGVEDEEMEDVGEEAEDEDGGDDKKYCTCRNVSFGNMVACDNDDCPYEWFHWGCVGITAEPKGKWFCDECRGKLGLT